MLRFSGLPRELKTGCASSQPDKWRRGCDSNSRRYIKRYAHCRIDLTSR
jgi:hypothetical protein